MPYQLSGGQRQCFALALALLSECPYILCDEITSNLDQETADLIFNVLKEEKNKTVIMVSHDESRLDEFDTLIVFNNKTIHVQKQSDSRKKVEKVVKEKQVDNKKLVKGYRRSFNVMKTVFIYLMILGITFAGVGYKYCFQVTNHVGNIQSMIQDDPYYLINSTAIMTDMLTGEIGATERFSISHLPFKEEVIEQIKQVEGITKVKPMLIFEHMPIVDNREEFTDCLYYQVDDNTPIKVTENRADFVEPYSNATYYDYQCVSSINQEGVIYITKLLADSLGVKDISNQTLTFKVAVPVGNFESKNISDGNVYNQNEYVKKEFSLPIRGILDTYYPNFKGNYIIYMPYEMMEQTLKEVDSKWQTNTLMIELDDFADKTVVKEKLKEISENISFMDRKEDVATTFKNLQEPELMMRSYLGMIVGLIIVLSLIYSYMQYSHDKDFFKPLYQIGYSKGVMSNILTKGILIDIGILSVLSLICTNIFYFLGVKLRILVQASVAQKEYMLVCGIAIGLSIIVTLLSYSWSIYKLLVKKEYVEN